MQISPVIWIYAVCKFNEFHFCALSIQKVPYFDSLILQSERSICKVTPPSFSDMFSEGDNFCDLLFAS